MAVGRPAGPGGRRGAVLAVAALVSGTLLAAPATAAQGAGARPEWRGVASTAPVVRLVADDTEARTSLAAAPRPPRRQQSVTSAAFRVRYTGFDDTSRRAFQAAVDELSRYISSPLPIVLEAVWEPLEPGVLGSAGPASVRRDFVGAPRPATWYPVALASALHGADLSTGPSGEDEADVVASFNSHFSSWYFGTDALPPTGTYDFMTVVLHELLHGLGFAGTYEYDAAAGTGSFGASGFPGVVDHALTAPDLRNLVSDLEPGSTELGDLLVGDELYAAGAALDVAAGSTRGRLFAPTSWEPGSSLYHWDEITYGIGDPESLMTPRLSRAEAVHRPGSLTLALLQDMGWSVDADADGVPASADLCPDDFDPAQADADADGAGDVCDPVDDLHRASGFSPFVELLLDKGIARGCAQDAALLRYCPHDTVTREQVAVLLLKSAGVTEVPAYDGSFTDVEASSPFAPWIAELARRGVVAGCATAADGTRAYCPQDPVTREQMAVMLLKTAGVGPDQPYAGTFADVPSSSPFALWIEELVRRGVTAGVGDGLYGPRQPATRAQMAVFLTKTFSLA